MLLLYRQQVWHNSCACCKVGVKGKGARSLRSCMHSLLIGRSRAVAVVVLETTVATQEIGHRSLIELWPHIAGTSRRLCVMRLACGVLLLVRNGPEDRPIILPHV